MSAEAPEVVVDRVSKVYHRGSRGDDFLALQNVDLAVGKGEFVTLLGPSGCGKTTLLKAIDGLVPITSGEIRVGGKAIEGPGPERAVVCSPNWHGPRGSCRWWGAPCTRSRSVR